jgi:hypothetical protein
VIAFVESHAARLDPDLLFDRVQLPDMLQGVVAKGERWASTNGGDRTLQVAVIHLDKGQTVRELK